MTRYAFALALAVCAACTSSPASPSPDNDGWGPLAVVDAPPNGDFARMPGALRLTDRCAMLEPDTGDLILLAWPANETAWQPETGTIAFRQRSGDVVELRDGDALVLGGSGEIFSGPEALGTIEDWIARFDWVSTPDDSCRTDRSWSIGDVSIGDN